jgi:hypothetical protein
MEIRDIKIIKRKEMFNFGGINFVNDINGHNILKGESLRKSNVQNMLLQRRFKLISEIQNEDNDEKVLINSNLIKVLEINEIISLYNNHKVYEDKLCLFQSIYSLNKLSSSNLSYINDIILKNNIHEEIFKILNKYSNNEIDYLDRLIIKHGLSLLNNLFYLNNNPLFQFILKNKYFGILIKFLYFDDIDISYQTIDLFILLILENEEFKNELNSLGIFEKIVKMAKKENIREIYLYDCLNYINQVILYEIKKTPLKIENISSCINVLISLIKNQKDDNLKKILISLLQISCYFNDIEIKFAQNGFYENITELIKVNKNIKIIILSLQIIINLTNENSFNCLNFISSELFNIIISIFFQENLYQKIELITTVCHLILNLSKFESFYDWLINNINVYEKMIYFLDSISEKTSLTILSCFYSFINNSLSFSTTYIFYNKNIYNKLLNLLTKINDSNLLKSIICIIIKLIEIIAQSENINYINSYINLNYLDDIINKLSSPDNKFSKDRQNILIFTTLKTIIKKYIY